MGEKFILGTEGSGIFSDDHELALQVTRGFWHLRYGQLRSRERNPPTFGEGDSSQPQQGGQ